MAEKRAAQMEKMEIIASASDRLVDLRKRQEQLNLDQMEASTSKDSRSKKLSSIELAHRNQKLDKEEQALCEETNLLIKDLISKCSSDPFFISLLAILENFKGIFCLYIYIYTHTYIELN